ncbi:DUF732 domain-containing protein [Mycolicibacter kumamotonensis]|uniref:DUF732 domain-containing protein n=1 Tax=Mycolicibacter kumamotonensis TaxID=354243 RepID=A0A7K3LBN2_9MYCO|nr:DUF732 domain-containing protein [Mycolicibacter kumamotonensis]NDJ89693.1 DUF732 domain-containing protein [Mycolicibacter kumamotonensis]
MAPFTIRPGLTRHVGGLALASLGLCVVTVATEPEASADAVAYLVNVTVRPGYNFADAGAALAYGNRICDQVAEGHTYTEIVDAVKGDLKTTDEYQAVYLINQAINELCPALIWQLRNSAAHYVSLPAAT